VRFGGDMGRSQGFGQANPQGPPVPQLGQGPGMPQGGGMYPNSMPPGPGIPPGYGMYPGGGMLPGQGITPGGGSIRNTLGSGLKSRGVFQKDGKITNSRGGFIGPKQGGGPMGSGPFSFLGQGGGGPVMNQPRQLILEAAQAGIAANGIATISPDNVFSCVANLPLPNTLVGQGYGTYAAYLVDQKGTTGFLAGVLRPIGSGVYQTQFRSQVPLLYYSRVLITVENPQDLGQAPKGPIILQVRQPMGPSRFLSPVKKAGGSVWQKIYGFVRGRGNPSTVPLAPSALGEGVLAPEVLPSVDPSISPLPPTN